MTATPLQAASRSRFQPTMLASPDFQGFGAFTLAFYAVAAVASAGGELERRVFGPSCVNTPSSIHCLFHTDASPLHREDIQASLA